jgi:phosphoglycolate phosphatase-like HAD superfamily hydrolase
VRFDLLGFDLDGVLVDSRAEAFLAAERLAAVFKVPAKVGSMHDYRETFGAIEAAYLPERADRGTLRALHRLAMRAQAAALPLFDAVIDLLPRARVPSCVISSALRGTVLTALNRRGAGAFPVLAHEDGLKEENLARWSKDRRAAYVTDNVRDVEHCHRCGVTAVGVAWGFDHPADLLAAGVSWLAGSADELDRLLVNLKLIGDRQP